MAKRNIKKLLKFLSFALTVWILCVAYAVTSIGD
jgi:hypothetical protein